MWKKSKSIVHMAKLEEKKSASAHAHAFKGGSHRQWEVRAKKKEGRVNEKCG